VRNLGPIGWWEEAMNSGLWAKLPPNFLKVGYKGWCRLDRGVQHLVVELAKKQHFKCALCSATRRLVIEHDHDPEEGHGDVPSILNIRGLACQRCNWHLRVYEAEQNGEYWNWENLSSRLSSHQYDSYDYAYRCRVSPLVEAIIEKRMGSKNYWRRRLVLQRFDAWYYDGMRSEWRERWKRDRATEIETPKQFLKALLACTEFVVQQMKKDPEYEPPEAYMELMTQVMPTIQQAIALRTGTLINSASSSPITLNKTAPSTTI
jgi:hypothetical protein